MTPGLQGETFPISRVTCRLHRESRSSQDRSELSKVLVTGSVRRWRGGVRLKPVGYSSSMCPEEWKAKLKCWVVRPHSYQCPHGVQIQVSRLVLLGILGPSHGHSCYTSLPQSWHGTWNTFHGWQWLHIVLNVKDVQNVHSALALRRTLCSHWWNEGCGNSNSPSLGAKGFWRETLLPGALVEATKFFLLGHPGHM